MLNTFRDRSDQEKGFTLIELLVVILIIGILAAIAIPSFLNQKSKAQDAQAKVVARTAQTAMETYATDHNGSYACGASAACVSTLNSIEPALITNSTSQAYLAAVNGASATGYTVVATDPVTGDSFSIVNASGGVSRSCSPGGQGACPTTGSWW
jgi:type IV pilus assembly protein PilA